MLTYFISLQLVLHPISYWNLEFTNTVKQYSRLYALVLKYLENAMSVSCSWSNRFWFCSLHVLALVVSSWTTAMFDASVNVARKHETLLCRTLTKTQKLRHKSMVSLRLNGPFTGDSGLASSIDAKDDGSGGDNWSYKSCEAPAKSSPPTNQHPAFYRPDALPVAQPTVSKQ